MNEEVCGRIAQAVELGSFSGVAAQAAGVERHTLLGWRRAGQAISEKLERGECTEDSLLAGDKMFLKLHRDIVLAQANAELRALQIIQTAAMDTWDAARWYLERRHPDRWGARHKTEVTGARGGPIATVGATVTIDELAAAMTAIHANRPDADDDEPKD